VQASNRTERMEHCLNVLWMNKNVAMAVDQVFGEVGTNIDSMKQEARNQIHVEL
jgi:hypothetical protein